MSFEPRILENGDIMVFRRFEDGLGTIGDGAVILKKGTPEHEKEMREIERELERKKRGRKRLAR